MLSFAFAKLQFYVDCGFNFFVGEKYYRLNGYFDTIFGCKITVKKPRNCVVSWLLSFSSNPKNAPDFELSFLVMHPVKIYR